jgi:hypothetical protein
MSYTLLVETSNPADIALIRSLLDSEGIVYFVQGEAFNAAWLPVEPVRFMVAEDRIEDAQALIRDLHPSHGPTTSGLKDSDGDG